MALSLLPMMSCSAAACCGGKKEEDLITQMIRFEHESVLKSRMLKRRFPPADCQQLKDGCRTAGNSKFVSPSFQNSPGDPWIARLAESCQIINRGS